MAEIDVSEKILASIRKDFNAGVKADAGISKLVNKIGKGKGTQKDMAMLADRFGIQASKAMKRNLILDELPNSTMYWNIAEKTIKPMLESAYKSINRYAGLQAQFADKKARINIKILQGGDPSDRIRAVMEMACNCVTQPELDNALTDPVIAAHRKFYDDFQKENAALRSAMGFREVVIREYDGVGLHDGKSQCEWCIERSGTWDYDEARDNGVFERHPGCGCMITHHTERGVNVQTDWTQNQWTMYGI